MINGDYSASKLISMGVLLGCGEVDEKADVVFTHCDQDFTDIIKKSDFRAFLGDLLSASIFSIPEIGVGKGDYFVSQDELVSYQDQLKVTTNTATNEICDKVFGAQESLAKGEFIGKCKSGDVAKIFSSHEVR
jgi:hypothetical protein